ncbi:MAG: PDZ domain-containing protein, partial [Phycisphaerae bacterium]
MKMRFTSVALVLAVAAAALGTTLGVGRAVAEVTTLPAATGIPQYMDPGLKSLVLVEYTLRNENASHEEVGQGIVVDEQAGVVLVAGAFIPEGVPMEWVKDIKIRVPNKKFTTIPAQFLGRTANRLFAYVKATGGGAALKTPALPHAQTGKVALGSEVFGVARFEKEGGYEPYTGIGRIRATLRLTHDVIFTQTFGLTRATSPVYDTQTGALVGITLPPLAESMIFTMGGNSARVQIKDDDQGAAFLPWEEVKEAFTDVPKEPFDARRPWLGIDGSTGMDEDLRTQFGIEQIAGLSVGSVIPGMPADKAGLHSTDIILTVDGKEFSESPVPDIMLSHFSRAMERTKIGQEVK